MRPPTFLFAIAAIFAAPASATLIQSSGTIVDNGGFGDFFSNIFAQSPLTERFSGQRLNFIVGFQNAEFITAQYNQEFSTFSQFWVESAPNVFSLGFGPDSGVASCTIDVGGSCLISNFTLAKGTISLRHMGNVIRGSVVYDNESFNECDGALFHVVGPICSEESGIIGPVPQFNIGELLITFNMPNGDGSYIFTLFSDPVPEPASWALMIAGFGIAGGALRLQQKRKFRNA